MHKARVTELAAAAALEALGDSANAVREGRCRLGIVFCVMAGCVNYSRRFYQETLEDPSTASPLIFPETVFNARESESATATTPLWPWLLSVAALLFVVDVALRRLELSRVFGAEMHRSEMRI